MFKSDLSNSSQQPFQGSQLQQIIQKRISQGWNRDQIDNNPTVTEQFSSILPLHESIELMGKEGIYLTEVSKTP